ncbi:VIT domain-containing protein [Azoarcus sp. KH32C]|uniref:VIT domain-containing protein n=1 Tax=Azoarcus sp. KH32C TaxID=748247 RepID=UPI0002386821|nr:VIT domain-containing protein [Azoarcus sp. KH32C]BAL23740.1 hypothetical protein AZKH_1418 [Azoarcus sp. KH32C]
MTEQIGIRTKSGENLALKGVEATARLAGLLATTTVVQQYENTTNRNLEIAYTFPLPVDAVLLSFAVSIGDRRYCGEVVPRSKAEAQYEEAVESGNAAFRLQSAGKGLYTATLGNVLAGEAVRIELKYSEPLAWNGQNLRYRMPTTLAPRYGEPGHLEPWQRPDVSVTAEYGLAVQVELFGELATASVASPSHAIRVSAEPGVLKVVLAGTGASMDRDFVLEMLASNLTSIAVTASALDTHVAMLTLLPPAVPSDAPRDTVLLLDCSGSMAGDSIRHAKEGVQLALGHLTSADRFGIIGFGSNVIALAPKLQAASDHALDQARRFVAELGDLGGTELTRALEIALTYAAGRPLDILLLTDGEAWNVTGAIATAQRLGARIFTVGIGAAVAEDTVRTLADATGGACELVSPNEDMSARIERHFMRMRQPRIEDVEITWPVKPQWVTRPARAIFAGDSYSVFAGFPSRVAGDFTATVKYSEAGMNREIPVRLNSAKALDTSIVRVAAASHLPVLAETSRQDWAVRYQLITDDTDYIVTLARSAEERAAELPAMHIVPHQLAAGWGGTGTVRFSRQGPVIAESAAPYAMSSSVPFNFDIPAVIRRASPKRSLDSFTEPRQDTLFDEFLTRLARRAHRRFLGGLPLSRGDLMKTHVPPELLSVFDEALAQGFSELQVACALHAALLLHACARALGARFELTVDKLLMTERPDGDLQERFRSVLDVLWDMARANVPCESAYDIPAFLRRQAD